jgi:hypothetical protein
MTRVCLHCGEPFEPGAEWAEHVTDDIDLFAYLTMEVPADAE